MTTCRAKSKGLNQKTIEDRQFDRSPLTRQSHRRSVSAVLNHTQDLFSYRKSRPALPFCQGYSLRRDFAPWSGLFCSESAGCREMKRDVGSSGVARGRSGAGCPAAPAHGRKPSSRSGRTFFATMEHKFESMSMGTRIQAQQCENVLLWTIEQCVVRLNNLLCRREKLWIVSFSTKEETEKSV